MDHDEGACTLHRVDDAGLDVLSVLDENRDPRDRAEERMIGERLGDAIDDLADETHGDVAKSIVAFPP